MNLYLPIFLWQSFWLHLSGQHAMNYSHFPAAPYLGHGQVMRPSRLQEAKGPCVVNIYVGSDPQRPLILGSGISKAAGTNLLHLHG